ncbi:MAG: cytochrome c [Methylococcaceae bacterium]|jgi:mono/diheme cytochrome c family protein
MKIFRKLRTNSVTYIGITLISLSVNALALDRSDIKLDVGKMEYDSACAVCHGLTGKGDGPLKSQLTRPVPDLTVLAKNNKGVFPFDRVYQIIDGRQEVKAHGPREMPVWGRAFNTETSIYFDNYPPQDSVSAVRSRILALTEYLNRLQN